MTAEGPNDIGDLNITVQYEVSNDTAEDWEYLEARTQVLDAGGRVVDETRDTQEQTVGAGETAEFEASLWGVKAKALGPVPEHAHVVVSVVACGMGQVALGEMAIPAEPFGPVALPSCMVGDVLAVVSGSLWKTEPDDDKDARVEVKLLVQSLTARHLPKVQLVADVTDKAGRELLDAGGNEEVRPAAICVIGGSGYAKDKKLAGAKATVVIRVCWPAAMAVTQRKGMVVSAGGPLASDSDSFSADDEVAANSDAETGGSATRQFYANMKWFDPADQPADIADLPREFSEAKALWDEDREQNLQRIVKLLSPFVGARFIPTNIAGWEELFVDQEGSGLVDIESEHVHVVGIDYAWGPLPRCKAEATFDVPVTTAFSSTDLDEWQEKNVSFTDAVVFYWNVTRNDNTEDLDFTSGDNQGVECLVCDEPTVTGNGSESSTLLAAAVETIVSEFREDPRNKVYVPFGTLTLSAAVELGRQVSRDEAARAVVTYLGGEVSDDDQAVYDGMVAVCGEIARSCFGEDDEDLDYSIDWVDEDEGWTAVVRPT